MRVYYDRDADVNLIKGKKVAIVGYGSQGHAHANNLKDSGVSDVRVALKAGSATAKKAEKAGFKVMTPEDAAKWADVVMMLTPDEMQADIYRDSLAPNMKEGAALAFAHGLNVHFNLIEPRKDLDIFMIAGLAVAAWQFAAAMREPETGRRRLITIGIALGAVYPPSDLCPRVIVRHHHPEAGAIPNGGRRVNIQHPTHADQPRDVVLVCAVDRGVDGAVEHVAPVFQVIGRRPAAECVEDNRDRQHCCRDAD